ncbi:MAG: acyl--CoA ligase [Lachnospiraceae bacterium]|nr:acyl--CoA ligase [Lachnospiraceae bacterium]
MTNSTDYFEDMLSDYERSLLPYVETIPLLLKKCAKDFEDKVAFSDDRLTLTYEEMYENIGRRINLLDSMNIPSQGHVAVLCRNNVDAMCWFLAIPSSGRVVIMLSSMINVETLEKLVDKFDVDALVAEECFLPLTGNLSIPIISAAECGGEVSPMADVTKDTTAAIFLTGGTTGEAKGVLLSHGALMRGAKNGTYKPTGEVLFNRYILLLPLSHIFGTVAGFLSCIYTGSTIYGCNDVRSGLMMIPRVKPTLLVLVPGIVELTLNLAKLKGEAFLEGLKCIVCGGAPVPPRLNKELKKFGIHLYPGYGMTEGANFTSANINIDKKPHSMGRIYPGQEVKLVDKELWIRGDNIMKGYYKDTAATAQVLTKDGWYKTGDLVSFDDEGYITIIGRTNNLIILPNGENVSPEEIEDAFNQSPLIQDCLVKEDTVGGQPMLSIEILPLPEAAKSHSPVELESLIREEAKKINNTLPSFKQVAKISLRTEDFKRTAALKIDRRDS